MSKAVLFLLGMWLLTIGLFLNQFRIAADLDEKLAEAEQLRETMTARHKAEIAALSNCITARENIHETAASLANALEQALGEHQDFATLPVPDGLRFIWEESDPGGAPE